MGKKDVGAVILGFFIVIASAITLSLIFGAGIKCSGFSCFETLMERCNIGSYINEEKEASWKYEVRGKDRDGGCIIEVTLLQAKEGEISLRDIEGHDMVCAYPIGVVASPERDLSLCHGRLKEDLQEILIEKLNGYILENLDEIEAELES